MKKYLITLWFALLFSCNYAQNTITIDDRIKPILIEFVRDAEFRGIDALPIIFKKVDSITFNRDFKYPYFGVYEPKYDRIQIASFTKCEDIILKVVVYHELAHLFLSEHFCEDCEHIMSKNPPKSFYKYLDNNIWEREKNKLFDLIIKNKEEW